MPKYSKPSVASRRQFLSLLGLGGLVCNKVSPVRMLMRSLVDGLIGSAQAAGQPALKNYVSILQPGAPPRWLWDGFLNPGNESISPNPCVQTMLSEDLYSGDSTKVKYVAEPVTLPGGGTIYLPPLWNRNMPTSSGSFVPVNALLGNTMLIRGIDMQADLGHEIGPAKVLWPLDGVASLTGLVGDASSTTIPVVGMMGQHNYADPKELGYKSLSGTAPALVNDYSDPLSAILSSFINTDSNVTQGLSRFNSKTALTAAMKSAMDELSTYAKSSLPGADVLYKSRANAEQLFMRAFGDLKAQFQSLHMKYLGIVSACAQSAIPSIIPSTGTAYGLGSTFSSELAPQFAIAEYLITNGFSSAISMCTSYSCSVGGIANFHDEHENDGLDRQKSVICHSFEYLSIAAMIYELKAALQAKGLWENTVIHLTGEFNRTPRSDGKGSDHASSANAMTIVSGAITKPIFIGNIASDSSNSYYQGTWGSAAPVSTSTGTRIITNDACASTVATLLGIQSPVRAVPLVSLDASGVGVTSLAEAPKNV